MELSEILRTLAVLLTAIIWGGLVVVDFVVTPARFRTPNVDRASANALGRAIFRNFGWVQLGVGLLNILVVILSGVGIEAILAALFILVFVALQVGFLEPSMAGAEESARQQLHRAYVSADIFKLVLGLILIGLLVIQS